MLLSVNVSLNGTLKHAPNVDTTHVYSPQIRIVILAALFIAGVCVGSHAQQPVERTVEGERARWNRIFTDPPARIRRDANGFLMQVAQELRPGTALDIGMGFGRNALFLARKGWTVTGIDISDVGVEAARHQAAAETLSLTAIRDDMLTFDYGQNRYDMILFMYMGPLPQDLADRITSALKTRGVVVMEHFSGGLPTDLPKMFPKLEVLRHSEVAASPDYAQQSPGRVVRFLARKRSDNSPFWSR